LPVSFILWPNGAVRLAGSRCGINWTRNIVRDVASNSESETKTLLFWQKSIKE